MRDISTTGSGHTRVLDDLLQNLLVAELAGPSAQLWILSPWISDIPVIDNSAGQFGTLLPALPSRGIRLCEALIELSRRGTNVRVVMRNDPKNAMVRYRLGTAAGAGPAPHVTVQENLHTKAVVGDRFLVTGSMNFTFYGQAYNQEHVSATLDPERIAEARMNFNTRYPLP